jgi:hypothetical protein
LGNLATPKSVQKLQTALHAKAKAEAGYRFYALYDKISREDILAHAYAQCRSNKGAPGIDGQDFADIEAYGVERWLAELALALRQETYRPEPIRRVFIPKANGGGVVWGSRGMDLKLAGKVVLITGSSRGIGLATAKAFATEGCHRDAASRLLNTETLHRSPSVFARESDLAVRRSGCERRVLPPKRPSR